LSVSEIAHIEQELSIWVEYLAALSAEARDLLKSLQAKVLRKGGINFDFETFCKMS
jgi:hypothetical protein